MLSYDDPRWETFEAGYRIAIDLRPLLRTFELGVDLPSVWEGLWEELFHQGDVGIGSFVAVPHLVRLYSERKDADWNVYALVATIELARAQNANPDVPDWARDAYDHAVKDLANLALEELPRASNEEGVRSMLGLLAIVHGARNHGRILIGFAEDEVADFEG